MDVNNEFFNKCVAISNIYEIPLDVIIESSNQLTRKLNIQEGKIISIIFDSISLKLNIKLKKYQEKKIPLEELDLPKKLPCEHFSLEEFPSELSFKTKYQEQPFSKKNDLQTLNHRWIKFISKLEKINITIRGKEIKIENPQIGTIFTLVDNGFGNGVSSPCIVTNIEYTNKGKPKIIHYSNILNLVYISPTFILVKYNTNWSSFLKYYVDCGWNVPDYKTIQFVRWNYYKKEDLYPFGK